MGVAFFSFLKWINEAVLDTNAAVLFTGTFIN